MKKFSKIIGLILIASILVGASTIEDSVTEIFEDVSQGDVLSVPFEYGEITKENISYDPTKLKFIGYKDGEYQFEALQDMDEVSISLYYSKTSNSEDTEHEGNNTIEVNPPSNTEGGEMGEWDRYTFNTKFKSGNLYYIYLDFSDYGNPDAIYYRDIPTGMKLDIEQDITIVHLKKNEVNSKVEQDRIIESPKVEFESSSNNFIIPIETAGYDGVYISYYTEPISGATELSNKFSVITKNKYEEIIMGGEADGNIKPDDEPKEENPPTEEDKEKPTPEDKPEEKPIPKPDKPKEPNPPIQGKPVTPPKDKEDEPIIEGEETPEDDEETEIEDDESEEEIEPEEVEEVKEDELGNVEDKKEPEPEKEEEKPKREEEEKEESSQLQRLPKTGSKTSVLYYMVGGLLILMGLTKLIK